MYGYGDDDTGELPRVERHESWTFDQHPVGSPYPSPPASDETTATFAVPSSHRSRARYAGGYPQAYGEPYRPRRETTVWWRSRSAIAVGLSVLALLVLGTAGFALLRGGDDPTPAAIDRSPTPTASEAATPSATPSPTSTASPTPTPKAAPVATRNPVPTAPPTTQPPAAEQPPDPVPTAPPNPGCTPTYDGTNAPMPQVRDALVAAGAKQYWEGVQLPSNLVGPRPVITVPAKLMKAIAWQESGWQSAIMACDGGIGTMQVMAPTVDHINLRFGMDYTLPLSLQENTEVGANYIEWLIMYYGAGYFNSNFDLALEAPLGANGEKFSLLDLVVAAYNAGPGSLEVSNSTALKIPNWGYVNNVEALMSSCVCLTY
jgi:Transglycosylase SLT domain